jgi:hypothetical protein
VRHGTNPNCRWLSNSANCIILQSNMRVEVL